MGQEEKDTYVATTQDKGHKSYEFLGFVEIYLWLTVGTEYRLDFRFAH